MESRRMFNLINKYTHNRKHEPQSGVEYVFYEEKYQVT